MKKAVEAYQKATADHKTTNNEASAELLTLAQKNLNEAALSCDASTLPETEVADEKPAVEAEVAATDTKAETEAAPAAEEEETEEASS